MAKIIKLILWGVLVLYFLVGIIDPQTGGNISEGGFSGIHNFLWDLFGGAEKVSEDNL